jgi:hypothetical protein
MRLFFFGSLMDLDVLEVILDRPVPPAEVVPARLDGYQRVRVRGETYPMLVPHPGSSVAGMAVGPLRPPELARVQYFEGGEYALAAHAVTAADGTRLEAFLFHAASHLQHDGTPWDFAAWQRLHKPVFLDMAQAWMALFGQAEVAAAEAQWQRQKAARAASALVRARRRARRPG